MRISPPGAALAVVVASVVEVLDCIMIGPKLFEIE
ncbi:hypothetical protein MARPU_12195 [Marichromatium purpuratum 984]|uniref:Uncharacterized protein n=1 Tax=Marichromatium purpuratum 984 TaxID=765910 RepID=W0E936_MARPU|nr:hypothetical protein MARPU_12195 [Marichromatium purpuratum 984]